MTEFELLRSRRRTLAIEVTADGRVLVRAPMRLSRTVIDRFVAEKQPWIEEKLALVKGAFSQADPLLLNFLCLLCEKRAFYALPACAAAYDKHYDEAHDILRATAFTAVKMDGRQCAALQKKLALLTGKQVILKNELAPDLIGGITLRYGGTQLTDSIRSRLDKLHRSLSDTII